MPASGPRDAAAFELREAMSRPGCAICSLALRSVGRFLSSLAYERVNDLQTRAELRARGGLCNPHAYRWLGETHTVLGTALIYRDVLRASLMRLADATPPRRRLPVFGRWLPRQAGQPTPGACPACGAQWDAEARYIGALLDILSQPAGLAAFEASQGVCLVHAKVAMERGGPASALVLARTRQAVEELVATLDEVIRKQDYRFGDEPRTESERAAGLTAVAAACGAEGLVARAED